MTDRLYHEDAYLTCFEARVVQTRQREDGPWLRLDRTAFYPTGGGQPHDEGWLAARDIRAQVVDVQAEGDQVWHRTDILLAEGTQVTGQVDWPRRFDHMQQHGGEHILAGSLKQLFEGFTHGLHIGRAFSTIDVTLPGGRTRLTAEEMNQLETLVNQRIQQNAPVKAWFPRKGELEGLPLRKDPTVTEEVRVIAVGDYEYCACGGTHPRATGEVGLLKVLDTQPARGKLRVRFVCGMRAVAHYQQVYQAATEAGQLLSAPAEQLAQEVQRQQKELQNQREQLRALRLEAARAQAEWLLASPRPLPGGGSLCLCHCPGLDPDSLKEVAGRIIKEPQAVALLSAPRQEGLALLFARGEQAPGDMAALMRQAGARGGGRPDWAQGSAQNAGVLEQAAALLAAQLDTLQEEA